MDSVVGTGGEVAIFWIIAPLMVIAALALLFARKPVHAAVGLIFVMIGMAFLYTMLEAPFLGVAQVVVYTGAIMILFVFVLMLVGVDAADAAVDTLKAQRWVAYVLGAGLVAVLAGVIVTATLPDAVGLEVANANTNPAGVAHVIFGATVFTLELVGVLLIVAALSAITLTHREALQQARNQKATVRLRQRAYARGEGSQVLTPMPAPGVYAEHNAADVPALDPYGRPIDISVPRVLRIRGQELDPASFDGHVAQIAEGRYLSRPPAPTPEQSAAALAAEADVERAVVTETVEDMLAEERGDLPEPESDHESEPTDDGRSDLEEKGDRS
ncbi:NADH dehydrogenase subunit J [Salana multivorans]|uniref:NADH-quinone oxidoreductase subunit J n=1 Tax=Salana multivorans TaxID=120377 RepID=A0A3N2D8F8_9MICO|nr:NADH-quinone oxidoreductase subunit J [Salana multivorans]ROR96067.1 NADH dehydrogenase subunit J [Salana multivorans]